MSHPFAVLVGCWALDAALMTVFWLWAVRLRNAGFVDMGWCLGISLDALAVLPWSGAASPLVWAVSAALWAWSLRLVLYLGRRVIGKPEDPRFGALRAEWRARGASENARLFGVFQIQGFLAGVFALPAYLAALRPPATIPTLSWAGLAVFALGLAGETLADAQLARFRARGTRDVCREGLWAYSRHPNYFFEFLVWLGLALSVLPRPYGAIALLCPALILFFLLRVTGIPATEAHALESRGEEYRRYREEVSAFVPWFPRRRGPSGR